MPKKRAHDPCVEDTARVLLYPSGEIVEAEIKPIVQRSNGKNFQIAFDSRASSVTADQIVEQEE